MIKAIMLIFEPDATWEKLMLTRKSSASLLFGYLLPVVLMSIAAELAGLHFWGRRQELSGDVVPISDNLALIYGSSQFVLSMATVFVAAKIMKACGETFHSRHTFSQCMLVVTYTMAPIFLLRMMDAFPWMNPWVTFAVGAILALPGLYHGIPRVLQPDPPHAFGLYLTSAVLFTVVAGLARLISLLILDGKLDKFIHH